MAKARLAAKCVGLDGLIYPTHRYLLSETCCRCGQEISRQARWERAANERKRVRRRAREQ